MVTIKAMNDELDMSKQEFAKEFKVYNLDNNSKMVVLRGDNVVNKVIKKGGQGAIIIYDKQFEQTGSRFFIGKQYLTISGHNVFLPAYNHVVVVNTESEFNEYLDKIEIALKETHESYMNMINNMKEKVDKVEKAVADEDLDALVELYFLNKYKRGGLKKAEAMLKFAKENGASHIDKDGSFAKKMYGEYIDIPSSIGCVHLMDLDYKTNKMEYIPLYNIKNFDKQETILDRGL